MTHSSRVFDFTTRLSFYGIYFPRFYDTHFLIDKRNVADDGKGTCLDICSSLAVQNRSEIIVSAFIRIPFMQQFLMQMSCGAFHSPLFRCRCSLAKLTTLFRIFFTIS